jgi:hypothetical protein
LDERLGRPQSRSGNYEAEKNLSLAGNLSPGLPGGSSSLYRLSYVGSYPLNILMVMARTGGGRYVASCYGLPEVKLDLQGKCNHMRKSLNLIFCPTN